jgi:hypothetical protein
MPCSAAGQASRSCARFVQFPQPHQRDAISQFARTSDLQKFSLTPPPNHPYIPSPSRPTERGVGHRHERGAGCGGRGSVGRVWWSQGGLIVRERTQRADDRRQCPAKAGRLRTAKPCGPDTRCWCQAGGGTSTQPGPNKPSIRWRRRQDEFVSGESPA